MVAGSVLSRPCAAAARIVEALEALYADRMAEQVDQFAHHALRGEAWGKALRYCRQAGAKAFAHSANCEAVAYFEQALGALDHLPESRDTTEQAIDLRIDLRNALSQLREEGLIFTRLREAEALAQGLNDQRRLGQVSAHLCLSLCNAGDQDSAIAVGRRTLAIAETLGDFALRVVTHFHLGQAYLCRGDYRRAVDCLHWNVASLQGDLLYARLGMAGLPSVVSRAPLVIGLAELGEFADGIARGEEGIRIAEAVDHPASLIAACHGLGQLYLRKGDLQLAIPVLERGLGLSNTWNILTRFQYLTWALGLAYALSGRLAEALPLLEEAVAWVASRHVRVYQARFIAGLGEAYLLAGRLDKASRLAERALALSRDHKERGNQAWVLWLGGEIAAHRDPPAVGPAEASYRQALIMAEALGMRPLLGHCHLGLGALYRRMGHLESARPELCTAITLFRSMAMTYWLTRAEVALQRAE